LLLTLFLDPQEERNYILQMVKKIRASGANVLLIQKSILRDAVTDLSLHYLVSERWSGPVTASGAGWSVGVLLLLLLVGCMMGGAGMLCVGCGAGLL
jgi:hypothetical protein